MSYLGTNPSVETVVFEGFADFATADASPKKDGRVVYVRNEKKFYQDNGTTLNKWSGTVYIEETRDPLPTDDISAGYEDGTFWENSVSGDIFVLQDNTAGNAVWPKISNAAGLPVLGKGSLLTSDGVSNGELTAGPVNSVNVYDPTEPQGIARKQIGGADGIAPLGADQKVPAINLPSYVDDIIEVADFASLPVTGETGKIYITLDNNKQYRWSGTVYVELNPAVSSIESYANLATFPATGQADVVYIAEDTNIIYRWNGSAYVELAASGGGVEQYADLASFPAVGDPVILYVAQDSDFTYVWDGSAYQLVGDGSTGIPTMAKGSLIGSNGTVNGEISVGTDDQLLVADSAQAAGLDWKNISSLLATLSNPVDGYLLSINSGVAEWIDPSTLGGGGMTIQGSVNITNLSSYTVPAGVYFQGQASNDIRISNVTYDPEATTSNVAWSGLSVGPGITISQSALFTGLTGVLLG